MVAWKESSVNVPAQDDSTLEPTSVGNEKHDFGGVLVIVKYRCCNSQIRQMGAA
jgi:hypothetical protein